MGLLAKRKLLTFSLPHLPLLRVRGPPQRLAGDFFTDQTALRMWRDHIQFIVNHVNPYTGVAHKEDPTIMVREGVREEYGRTSAGGGGREKSPPHRSIRSHCFGPFPFPSPFISRSPQSWQLANEPRAKDSSSFESTKIFIDWIANSSTFIKGLAPKQLVCCGMEGDTKWFAIGQTPQWTQNASTIDYVTAHMVRAAMRARNHTRSPAVRSLSAAAAALL